MSRALDQVHFIIECGNAVGYAQMKPGAIVMKEGEPGDVMYAQKTTKMHTADSLRYSEHFLRKCATHYAKANACVIKTLSARWVYPD